MQGPSEVSALPASRYGEWTAGDGFFMIAAVGGARQAEVGTQRVQVTGRIVAVDASNPEAPPALRLEWSPLVLDPGDWGAGAVSASLVGRGVWRQYDGAQLTGHAFDRQFEGLGKYLVTIAAWLFALSTMISWSYYGEQGMVYMLGDRSVLVYKLVFLVGAIWAATAIRDKGDMEVIMDLGTGAMLWSNLPIVIGLGFLAVRALSDYHHRLSAGEFHPHAAPPITEVVEDHDHER